MRKEGPGLIHSSVAFRAMPAFRAKPSGTTSCEIRADVLSLSGYVAHVVKVTSLLKVNCNCMWGSPKIDPGKPLQNYLYYKAVVIRKIHKHFCFPLLHVNYVDGSFCCLALRLDPVSFYSKQHPLYLLKKSCLNSNEHYYV